MPTDTNHERAERGDQVFCDYLDEFTDLDGFAYGDERTAELLVNLLVDLLHFADTLALEHHATPLVLRAQEVYFAQVEREVITD